MNLHFHGTQILYRNLTSRARITINRGGTRSSKSFSLLQLILIKALFERKKKFLFLRKTFPSLRLSSMTDFKMIISDLGLWPNIRQEKQTHDFFLNGNLIHFDSLDQPEKKKSTSWNYIIFEEMPDFTFDDFLTMQLYLSAHPGPDGVTYEVAPGIIVEVRNQIFGALNPIDENCWIKTELIDNPAFEVNEIVSTYKDNIKNLHPDVVRNIKNLELQDNNFYRVYTCGQWGRLENIIYSNWVVVQTIDMPDERQTIETVYGVDFGYSNEAAVVRIDIADRGCYVTELVYASKLKTDDLIERMDETIPHEHKVKYMFCDNAEPASIDQICEAGYNAYPAEKDVRDGINCVKQQKLKIHASSTNLIKELRGYSYKKDKDGKVLEEPIKFKDHACDALRYALFSYYQHVGRTEGEIFIGSSIMSQ